MVSRTEVEQLSRSFYQLLISLVEENERLTAQVKYSIYARPGHVHQRHSDAVSPGIPKGYETVLSYLAKWRPDLLDPRYGDPVSAIKVTAPPCFSGGVEGTRR